MIIIVEIADILVTILTWNENSVIKLFNMAVLNWKRNDREKESVK